MELSKSNHSTEGFISRRLKMTRPENYPYSKPQWVKAVTVVHSRVCSNYFKIVTLKNRITGEEK